jgi:hypothetical protein
MCNGTCTDTNSDPLHCGGCNSPCALGDTCVNGQCMCAGAQCNTNQGPVCSDPQTDPLDCGGCNKGCGTRNYCAAGMCQCKPGLTSCNGNCVDTDKSVFNCGGCGVQCAQGQRCFNGTCLQGPCNAINPKLFNCGNNACYTLQDLASDPLNCGQCGNACAGNEVCAQGQCQPYITSPACNACPCNACPTGSACCTYPGGNFPICVAGGSCPQ